MADIKNIDELRDHAINTLKKLEKRQIEVVEAGVTAKLYESVMSSLKIEMEYNKMLGVNPNIKFLGGSHIIHQEIKALPSKKSAKGKGK